jgi:hypothetical protein
MAPRVLAVFFFVAVLSQPADALTIVQTNTVWNSIRVLDARVPTSTTGPIATSFSSFDPSLGDLISVHLEADVTATLTVAVDVPRNRTISAAGSQATTLTFFDLSNTMEPLSTSITVNGGIRGNFDSTSVSSPFLTDHLFTKRLKQRFESGGNLVAVFGVTTSLTEFLAGCTGPEATRDCSADVTGQIRGDVTLTYTYVPEPSTALLVSLGLVGITARQRWPRAL